MNDFEFSLPTKVYFGKNSIDKVAECVKEYSKNILIHYGSDRIKENGLLDVIKNSLSKKNINFNELGGVQANPLLSKCNAGIDLCREKKIDFIIAVGGGSVIDSAKTISIGVPYNGNVWDFYINAATVKQSVPIGVILTIPAAASETNGTAVITNERIMYKRNIRHDLLKPVFAIMDPEATFSLPPYQTASGCIDIIAHTWERYFTKGHHSFLMDKMSEAVFKTIIQYAPIALREPDNYNARSEIMWASSIAHNDMLGSIGDFASHSIAVELSALYNMTHGASLAIAMIAWAKYVMDIDIERFCEFSENVWGITRDTGRSEDVAYQGIKATEYFFNSLGIPTKLSDAGIPHDQFDKMAEKALDNGVGYVGFSFKHLYKDDLIKIYKLAY